MDYLKEVLVSFVSTVFSGVMKDISPDLIHIGSIIVVLLCLWAAFKFSSKIIKAISIIISIILLYANFL